ncbi:NUDIX domain-containing protein [Granulosicoccaceae sp. 1_MG-2023]|nr:NUDIX domain-containing protein [Granulosicoccaceae sp. 1_MG-2023]
MRNPLPLNTGVVTAVILQGDKLLMMLRQREGFWCHVAGKIEQGETAVQAVLREIREETGLLPQALYTAEFVEQFYEVRKNRLALCPAFVALAGDDAVVQLNREHREYRWCTVEEAHALASYPNQHLLYDHIARFFLEQAPSSLMQVFPFSEENTDKLK